MGNHNANAVYSQVIPKNPNLGKVGYVDDKGTLSEYPSNMISKGDTYTSLGNFNNPPETFNKINVGDIGECKQECSKIDKCGGFS